MSATLKDSYEAFLSDASHGQLVGLPPAAAEVDLTGRRRAGCFTRRSAPASTVSICQEDWWLMPRISIPRINMVHTYVQPAW